MSNRRRPTLVIDPTHNPSSVAAANAHSDDTDLEDRDLRGPPSDDYQSSDEREEVKEEPRTLSALLPPLPTLPTLHQHRLSPPPQHLYSPRARSATHNTSPRINRNSSNRSNGTASFRSNDISSSGRTAANQYLDTGRFTPASLHGSSTAPFESDSLMHQYNPHDDSPYSPSGERTIETPRTFTTRRILEQDHGMMGTDGANDEYSEIREERTTMLSHDHPSIVSERVGNTGTSSSSRRNANYDGPSEEEDLRIPSYTARTAMILDDEEHPIGLDGNGISTNINPRASTSPIPNEIRHYEGCMLCDPLPAPRDSLSSSSDIFDQYQKYNPHQELGPPPDMPLPPLPSRSPVPPDFFEGEIAPPAQFVQSPRRAYTPERTNSQSSSVNYEMRAPIYTSPKLQHLKSLSTLIERDEDHNSGLSPQQSHVSSLRASHENMPRATYSIFPPREPENKGLGIRPFATASDTTEVNLSMQRRPSAGSMPTDRPLSNRHAHMPSIQGAMQSVMRGNRKDPNEGVPPVMGSALNQYRDLNSPSKGSNIGSITNFGSPGGAIRHRGPVDGAYEMSDIDTSKTLPIHKRQQSSPPLGPFQHMKRRMEARFGKKKFRWLLIGTGIFLILLFVILMVSTLGFQSMAQKAVNKARVDVSGAILSDFAQDSVKLDVQVAFNRGTSDTSILPSAFRVSTAGSDASNLGLYDSKPDLANSRTKRNHILNHVPLGNSKNSTASGGTLGYVKVNRKMTLGTKRQVEVVGSDDGGRFKIQDTSVWEAMVEKLIFSDYDYEVDVEGDVKVQYGLLKSSPKVKKTVKLPSMNGIDATVSTFIILPNDTDTDFLIRFFTNSRGPAVSLLLADVEFDLIFDGYNMGTVLAPQFHVHPSGASQTTLQTATGRINQTTINLLPGIYGEMLTAIQNDYDGLPQNGELLLRGSKITKNGEEIPWMRNTIQKLRMRFALEPPNIDTNSKFELAFKIDEDGENRTARAGYIGTDASFPVAGNLNDLIYSFHIQTIDAQPVAHLFIPLGSMPREDDNKFRERTFSEAKFIVDDGMHYGSKFLLPLVMGQNTTLLVSGAISDRETINSASSSITHQPWIAEGFNGFKEGSTLGDFRFLGSGSQGLVMSATLGLSSSSKMSLSLRNKIVFMLTAAGGNTVDFGELEIQSLDISRGRNSVSAQIRFRPASDSISYNDFFSGLLGGRGGQVRVRGNGAYTSESLIVAAATEKLDIPARFSSWKVEFIDSISFMRAGTGLDVVIGFVNSFEIDTSVTSIEMSVQEANRAGGGRTLGGVDRVQIPEDLLASGELKELRVPFVLEKNIGEGVVRGYNGGLRLSGKIGLRWGTVKVVVDFEKEVMRSGSGAFA